MGQRGHARGMSQSIAPVNFFKKINRSSALAQSKNSKNYPASKGITDLHRDKIDHITIPSKEGRGDLKRIEEIFDCWFESGRYEGCIIYDVDSLNFYISMPYAQLHYPFENKELFESALTLLISSPRALTRLAAGSIPYSFFQHTSLEKHLEESHRNRSCSSCVCTSNLFLC